MLAGSCEVGLGSLLCPKIVDHLEDELGLRDEPAGVAVHEIDLVVCKPFIKSPAPNS